MFTGFFFAEDEGLSLSRRKADSPTGEFWMLEAEDLTPCIFSSLFLSIKGEKKF
jgi:hypothetical protein